MQNPGPRSTSGATPVDSGRRDNLPVELTTFVGRNSDLDEITTLLEHSHAVTLTGEGGVGKSRLARHIASRLLGTFADGVWLVELASFTDSRLIPQAVAAVLDVREDPGTPISTSLPAALHAHQCLLVLDNCEHLLDGCAQLVGDLLDAAPGLRILTTSRTPLGIQGEVIWRVQPLRTPPDASHSPALPDTFESIELFVERARAVLPGFVPSALDAFAIRHRLLTDSEAYQVTAEHGLL